MYYNNMLMCYAIYYLDWYQTWRAIIMYVKRILVYVGIRNIRRPAFVLFVVTKRRLSSGKIKKRSSPRKSQFGELPPGPEPIRGSVSVYDIAGGGVDD